MNLRDFKKDVEYFVGDFIDDCALFLLRNPEKATDEVSAVIEEAVDLYNEMKDKGNAKVDAKKSTYYAGLRKEMFEKIDALYEKLSDIIASQKDAKPKKEAAPKAAKPAAAKKAPAAKAAKETKEAKEAKPKAAAAKKPAAKTTKAAKATKE
ncbi:MAG: hypothetical protein IKR88_01730 [Bacteroidales bacterium]|jgi:hypothetical protein|nr:hypothetical protein [Bacteroidales bacterium]MBR6361988.1 hypothetical protein [Bacteroidales bacterium]